MLSQPWNEIKVLLKLFLPKTRWAISDSTDQQYFIDDFSWYVYIIYPVLKQMQLIC